MAACRNEAARRVQADGQAALPYFAFRLPMVGVITQQCGQIEGYRESRLQVAVTTVGFFRRGEARELSHGPQPSAVHGFVDAARVRKLPWLTKFFSRSTPARSCSVYRGSTGAFDKLAGILAYYPTGDKWVWCTSKARSQVPPGRKPD